MKKSRLALNSAVIFGAGLCWLPGVAWAQSFAGSPQTDGDTIYTGSGGTGAMPNRNNYATPTPGQFGNNADIITSVVVTTGYEDLQNTNTTVPANAITQPTLFFQINVYNPSTGTATDITNSAQSGYYTDYDLALETSPGAGLTSSPATVSNAYSAPFGISTGEDYFIPGYNNKSTNPSTSGSNQVLNYSNGAWSLVAGQGSAAFPANTYVNTTTVITTTSMTYGIPLSALGLNVGNNFTFDAYTTFGTPGGQSAYDDLDDPSFAPANYLPFASNTYANSFPAGDTAPTPFDSATYNSGTNQNSLASYTVLSPTLTWNNAGAPAGTADGITWVAATDSTATTSLNYNWNNGMYADYYVDGANVVFSDSIGGTSSANVTLTTTVSPGSVTVNNNAESYTITGGGLIVDTGAFTKSGSNTLTLGVGLSASSVAISGGKMILAAGTTANSGWSATNPVSDINISSLTIAANSVLDITNNHIIIDYGASDPMSTILGYLKSGFNNSGWNGTSGIISSAAQTKTNGLTYSIGWADGADKTGAVKNLTSGEIELKYTLVGDANLDGTVNGSDFSILAANFGLGVTNWDQGNFLYSSSVNGSDFSALAANFGQGDSGASVTPADIAALDAFAAANGLPAPDFAAVPEPATLSLAALAGVSIMARRRGRKGIAS